MKLKQKISLLLVGIAAVTSICTATGPTSYADDCSKDPSKCCGGVETSIIHCAKDDGKGSTIMTLLLIVVNTLAVGVGIAAVGGIAWAAILYATAEDKPSQVSQAKMIIFNVVLGLVAYFLMFSLLNFLVPGGVLH